MREVSFILIFVGGIISMNNLSSQSQFSMMYEVMNPETPEIRIFEYHEWSAETQYSINLDSSLVSKSTVSESDERGIPTKINKNLTPNSLKTKQPMFKNTKEEYIVRTVLNPDKFLTDPNVVVIKEEYFNFEWEITEESKIISDLHCFRATTTFRCQEWEAWFAPEIPINSGPFIFHGLPGLIIKIKKINQMPYYELREFGELTHPTLNLEKLGLESVDFDDLPQHCDLKEVFDNYVKILKAKTSNPNCVDCTSTINKVKWSECWDECD